MALASGHNGVSIERTRVPMHNNHMRFDSKQGLTMVARDRLCTPSNDRSLVPAKGDRLGRRRWDNPFVRLRRQLHLPVAVVVAVACPAFCPSSLSFGSLAEVTAPLPLGLGGSHGESGVHRRRGAALPSGHGVRPSDHQPGLMSSLPSSLGAG